MNPIKETLDRYKNLQADLVVDMEKAAPNTRPGLQMAKNRAELAIKTVRQQYHNEAAKKIDVVFQPEPFETDFWLVDEMDFFKNLVKEYDPGFDGVHFSAQNLNNLLLGLKEKGAELGVDSFDRPSLEVFLRGQFSVAEYPARLKKSFNFQTWKAFVPAWIRQQVLDEALEVGYDGSLGAICIVSGNLSKAEQAAVAERFSGQIQEFATKNVQQDPKTTANQAVVTKKPGRPPKQKVQGE